MEDFKCQLSTEQIRTFEVPETIKSLPATFPATEWQLGSSGKLGKLLARVFTLAISNSSIRNKPAGLPNSLSPNRSMGSYRITNQNQSYYDVGGGLYQDSTRSLTVSIFVATNRDARCSCGHHGCNTNLHVHEVKDIDKTVYDLLLKANEY